MTVKGNFVDLGTRLRAVRKERKLTQTALAEIGGVGKYAQIRFEKGENIPNAAYLLKLYAIGIDTHYIMTGQPGAMSAEEAELLLRFRAADEEGKRKMLGVGK